MYILILHNDTTKWFLLIFVTAPSLCGSDQIPFSAEEVVDSRIFSAAGDYRIDS